jgi:hypothetical protein
MAFSAYSSLLHVAVTALERAADPSAEGGRQSRTMAQAAGELDQMLGSLGRPRT